MGDSYAVIAKEVMEELKVGHKERPGPGANRPGPANNTVYPKDLGGLRLI